MTLSILTAGLLIHGAWDLPRDVSTTELRSKAYRTWNIELPADPFRAVSGSFPIPHAGGEGFTVEASGIGLAIDTDGDGEVDRTIEGREHPETKIRHARVVLSGTDANGNAFRYPVRLEGSAGTWKWAPGGALVGDIDGTSIELIDLDGNGHHGDVGRDAVVVGNTGVAQFLGETIAVGDSLFEVAFDASSAQLSPFTGEVGVLDLHAAFGGKGVLLAAVVKSVDGRQSFELSEATEGLRVPVGRYKVVSATLGLGESRVTIDPSGMKSIAVESGARTELEWGAPVRASFGVQRNGEELVLDPREVRYLGAAGEEWLGWDPIGKSPTFSIKEKDTGDVLVDVVFPGSC